jgi:hypothetical protein
MKPIYLIFTLVFFISCNANEEHMKKVIFLHRSTGLSIYLGKTNPYVYKITKNGDVRTLFKKFNRRRTIKLTIKEQHFASPISMKNNPVDYYNVWIKNAGDKPFMVAPNLELLTKEYDIIILKHCFSASNILEDTGYPDIDSEDKRVENYKLHYEALKMKFHEFPKTKFIVWTPAVQVKNLVTENEALRTRDFYRWIVDEWDEKGDNIYIWDFYKYETEGGLYLKDELALNVNDSHPGKEFSVQMAYIFTQFVYDVAEDKIE